MDINLYDVTVPTFIKLLGGLKNVLAKAEAFAQEKGMQESALLEDRLAPDMFPLVKQVQVACDNAKGATARLAGVEVPKMEDNEKTIQELQNRIDKTLAFVQSVPETSFADAHARQITLPYFPDKFMHGEDYALQYAIPNFIFHVTTAYGIVRKNGVPIGKADFMNGMPLQDMA